MGNVLATAARQGVRVLVFQIGCVIAIAGGSAVVWGARVGGSVLVGGVIGLVGTIYIVATLFKHSFDHGVRLGVGNFFVAWAIKAGLTLALLFLALRSRAFSPVALIGGLSGALFAYWLHMTFMQVKQHAVGSDGK
jgi:F0F1-type ATP synthase assembly protein I